MTHDVASTNQLSKHPKVDMPILMPMTNIFVPTAAAGRIGGILRKGRWYEQEMLEYITSLALSGAYLDIGANIGNHSIYFACNTPAEKIFAFEPSNQALQILRSFIDLNGYASKIEVVPFAASDRDGEVSFIAGTGGIAVSHVAQARRIDDLINGAAVSVIKIDIEGAEPQALRGALKTLEKYKPVLFIEIHTNREMDEIAEIVEPLGYSPSGKVFNYSPTYEFRAG